ARSTGEHPAGTQANRGSRRGAGGNRCLSLRTRIPPLTLPRMAAAQGRLSDDAGGMDEAAEGAAETHQTAPPSFRAAVGALKAARPRREIEPEPPRPPQRLAPYACALEASAVEEGEVLADGRLVLLHDPAGHDAWQGSFRLVTLVRAELEAEMAADPLLPE